MSIFQQFLQRTSIHGIPEISNSKTYFGKIFWVCCISVCFGYMVGEIYYVVNVFNKNSIASRLRNVQSGMYQTPSILLCPGRYFNSTKVVKAEISAFAAFSKNDVVFPAREKARIDGEIKKLATYLDVAESNYPELLSYLSFEWNELIDCEFCFSGKNGNRVFTIQGVCYVARFFEMAIFTVPDRHRSVVVHLPKSSLDMGDPDTVKMFFGYLPGDLIPIWETLLTMNSSYQIRSAAQRNVVIEDCRKNVSEYVLKICIANCTDLVPQECANCSNLGALYQQGDPSKWCSAYDLAVHPTFAKCTFGVSNTATVLDFLDCMRNCQSSCEITTYQISVFQESSQWSPSKEENRVDITSAVAKLLNAKNAGKLAESSAALQLYIIPESIFIRTDITEFEAYDHHSFIANIGGQLGLWCGISVISAVQILFYVAKAAVLRLKNWGRQTDTSNVDLESGQTWKTDKTWSFETVTTKPFVMFNPAAYRFSVDKY